MKRVFPILAAACFSNGAFAETVVIQSGEHSGFSRLVVSLERPTDWHFGRVNGGYELRLGRPEVVLDVSKAFDLIPHDRLRDLIAVPGTGVLRLLVECVCYAKVIEYQPGVLVVDVHSGAAPSGSPFEAALNSAADPLSGQSAFVSDAGTDY